MARRKVNSAPSAWQNRIVRYSDEDPTQLLAHPDNFRIHPKSQQDALGGVLAEVGWVAPVIINSTTQYVLDGHLRIELAISRGEPTVPCAFVELSEESERLILATFDPIGALAAQDQDKLNELLAGLETSNEYLVQFMATLRSDEPKILHDDDADLTTPTEPITRPGDLWILGEHRLLCGDATNEIDLLTLMDGAKAELVWTDPPYGVAVGDKNKWLNTIGPSNRIEDNLTGDTLDATALHTLIHDAFTNIVKNACQPGCAWYVTAPAGPLHLLFGQVLNALGIWRQTIQWVKNNATFAPMGVDYHWRCEPMFYGWLPNASHRYYGGRTQDTVWEIDRPHKSPLHPTTKPIELIGRSISNSTQEGELVLDPFVGSGSTMVAAEQLNRTCYAMEIEPVYCDVVVRRWETITGRKAERQEDFVLAMPKV